jgi:hypothetical protein
VLGLREALVGGQRRRGLLPRQLQQVPVANQRLEGEVRQAVLPRSQQLARAPDAQVRLRDFEAVARPRQRRQARFRFLRRLFGRDGDEVGGAFAPAHAAAQLVELRQAVAVRVLDDHHGGVGDV